MLPGEAVVEELGDEFGRGTVGRRQTRQHRIRLQGAVRDQSRAFIDGDAGDLVILVPRGEARDDDARIDRGQRRVRSRADRTSSAVSTGSRSAG